MIIKVKDTYTGKIGTMDDSEMSARYQPIQQTQTTQPTISNVQTNQPQQQSPSIGGFLGNVLKSGAGAVGGIGSALLNVLNPNMDKNTVANLAKLGIGAGQLLIPGEQGLEQKARDVGNFYNQRYGITDLLSGNLKGAGQKVGKTLYEDPVGSALDLSAVLGLGGGVLKTAGKLSKVTDPLQQLGKVVNPKIGGVVNKVSNALEETGANMPTKILKASPVRVTKFEEILPKGTTINDFITENGLVGTGGKAFNKANEAIKTLQEQYNNLARSKTTTINPSDYTNAIDAKIAQIKSSNYTPGAEKVVSELEKTRDSFMRGVTENKEISGVPIDKFTNIKTSTVGKANKFDPYALDADRIAGQAMINVIDKYAPGSAEIGKKLQQLREFKDLASKVPTGKNTNILGLLKPSGTGAAIGGVVGGAPGALIGAVAGIASQNPAIMQLLGNIASKTGSALPTVAGKSAQVISKGEQFGNLMRLINPVNNENSQVNGIIPPTNTPPIKTTTQNQEEPKVEFTADKLAMAIALDPKNKDTYQSIYDALQTQKTNQAAQKTAQEQTNEVKDTVSNIDSILNSDLTYATGFIGKNVNIPGTKAYDLKKQIQQVKDQLSLASVGKLKGQGQVSDAERAMLANSATALDTGMTEKAFKAELEKVKKILERKL